MTINNHAEHGIVKRPRQHQLRETLSISAQSDGGNSG